MGFKRPLVRIQSLGPRKGLVLVKNRLFFELFEHICGLLSVADEVFAVDSPDIYHALFCQFMDLHKM